MIKNKNYNKTNGTKKPKFFHGLGLSKALETKFSKRQESRNTILIKKNSTGMSKGSKIGKSNSNLSQRKKKKCAK